MSAKVENAAPVLCLASLSAVTCVKIPPVPDDESWQQLKNSPLDLAPQPSHFNALCRTMIPKTFFYRKML